MRIFVGSENPSKINAVKQALKTFDITNCEIIPMKVSSEVSNLPTNEEIVKGVVNRNNSLKERINGYYDYIISIEGGFTKEDNAYYLVTYAVVADKYDTYHIGKSISIPLSEKMFAYSFSGKSLNRIIEELVNVTENNKKSGISGYLSKDLFKRDKVDSDAVRCALLPFIYEKRYEELNSAITKKNRRKSMDVIRDDICLGYVFNMEKNKFQEFVDEGGNDLYEPIESHYYMCRTIKPVLFVNITDTEVYDILGFEHYPLNNTFATSSPEYFVSSLRNVSHELAELGVSRDVTSEDLVILDEYIKSLDNQKEEQTLRLKYRKY